MNKKKRIALIGGGPSALYICKHFINGSFSDIELHIFEKTQVLGAGMPYSNLGANPEHISNISDIEIPPLVNSIHEWIYTVPADLLQPFHITPATFNEYEPLPRLFLGTYLSAQFQSILDTAVRKGIGIQLHLNHTVRDIQDKPDTNEVCIYTENHTKQYVDSCIICTGHSWKKEYEGKISGYYDSPYPPSKLLFKADHAVAIRGSSLTAIDAVRTMARTHGTFSETENGLLKYHISDKNKEFRIVLHSSNGMLPAIRIHVQAKQTKTLPPKLIEENRKQHNGFLSLDFVFDTAFKEPLKEKDPAFHERIKYMNMEAFVDAMLKSRERQDPFLLFAKEYKEAEISIHNKQPIYWKTMLAELSFVMNYPAKYFSAEDTLRLQKTLSELISIVIAFIPQSSAKELMALHAAGILDIVDVDSNSHVDPVNDGGIIYHYTDEHKNSVRVFYHTYIDAVGQASLPIEAFPFKTLVEEKTICQARLKFQDTAAAKKEQSAGNKDVQKSEDDIYYLNVSGIAINDAFQVVNEQGIANERIYVMAVPYISGYNPDYSGLDFCDKASQLIYKHFVMRHTK